MTGITAAFRLAAPSIGSNRRADAGAECVEAGVTGRALHDRLDLGPVLVMVTQGRQRHLRLPRLAVAQDQEASSVYALGQHVTAQGGGGQRREPRLQRGEDGFSGGGHDDLKCAGSLKKRWQRFHAANRGFRHPFRAKNQTLTGCLRRKPVSRSRQRRRRSYHLERFRPKKTARQQHDGTTVIQ